MGVEKRPKGHCRALSLGFLTIEVRYPNSLLRVTKPPTIAP